MSSAQHAEQREERGARRTRRNRPRSCLTSSRSLQPRPESAAVLCARSSTAQLRPGTVSSRLAPAPRRPSPRPGFPACASRPTRCARRTTMAYHPQVRSVSCLALPRPRDPAHPPLAPPRSQSFQYQPSSQAQPGQAHQQNSMQAILNHQDSYSVVQQQQLVGDEEYKCVVPPLPSLDLLGPGTALTLDLPQQPTAQELQARASAHRRAALGHARAGEAGPSRAP